MKHRILGKTGYSVSEIGLGCWQLGGDFGAVSDNQASAILTAADSLGVDFWDTADVYGGGVSEQRIGAALAGGAKPIVATKLGRGGGLFPDNYSLTGLRDSLKGSIERLGVEKLDLAQLHCVPGPVLDDGSVFKWMDTLKDEGLVAHWGVSVETIEEGLLCLEQPGCATLQIIFNLFRQDAAFDLLPRAADAEVGIIVRLPLASGLLSGKFTADHQFDDKDHRNYNRDGAAFNVGETFAGLPFDKGVELAGRLASFVPEDIPMSQFAIRWILDHAAVSSVIAGVTRPDQLEANVAASRLPPIGESTHADLTSFYEEEVRSFVRGSI